MPDAGKLIAQVLAYGAFIFVIAYFSVLPAYEHLGADKAMIKLAFSHAGAHRYECKQLPPEELAKLPTNRRKPADCKRERMPIVLELFLDGQQVFSGVQQATGLWHDGPSHVYKRFPVVAGSHELTARLRDSRREDGSFDYEAQRRIELQPGQNLVIGFRPAAGGFIFD